MAGAGAGRRPCAGRLFRNVCADAEGGADGRADLPAGLDVFGRHRADDGHHDVRDVFHGFRGEAEHRVERGGAVLRVADRVVFFGVRRVQADGDRVDQPAHFDGGAAARDAVRKPVRVDAQLVRPHGLDLRGKPEHVVPAAGGLAVAAEDDLAVFFEVAGADIREHGFLRRLRALVPEVVGVQAAAAVLPQAEVAGVRALVRHVDVQVSAVFIGDGHRIASF